jgi:glutamate dehydrogenase/leucine dehydrogenase
VSIDVEFDHEEVQVFRDPATGTTGVVAIHSTVLGPSMGGLRVRRYRGLSDAVVDAMRLARAMTFKNAAAGLDLGGGKAVVLDAGDPDRRADRMRAFGRVVERLDGRYVTAEDVGTSPADMDAISEVTHWVTGRPVDRGGRGDPSPATARTVCGAIAAAVAVKLGMEHLRNVRVGVLGVGSVGSRLAGLLSATGADVTVADIDEARAREIADATGSEAASIEGFVHGDFDVLAPCAVGDLIGPADVDRLRCSVIAGAANNPLASVECATRLHEAGILYVPDFLANCGGIIHVGAEVLDFDDAEVERRIEAAILRTTNVLIAAVDQGQLPLTAAMDLARARLLQAV